MYEKIRSQLRTRARSHLLANDKELFVIDTNSSMARSAPSVPLVTASNTVLSV